MNCNKRGRIYRDLKCRKLTQSFAKYSLGWHPGGLPAVLQVLTPWVEWVQILFAFSMFVINVFLKKKIHKRKSAFESVTKIHFQFWQSLQQEHQPPRVLSWRLWVLKTRENKFHQPHVPQDKTFNSKNVMNLPSSSSSLSNFVFFPLKWTPLSSLPPLPRRPPLPLPLPPGLPRPPWHKKI